MGIIFSKIISMGVRWWYYPMVSCFKKMRLQLDFSPVAKIESLYFFINETIPDRLLNLLLCSNIEVAHWILYLFKNHCFIGSNLAHLQLDQTKELLSRSCFFTCAHPFQSPASHSPASEKHLDPTWYHHRTIVFNHCLL